MKSNINKLSPPTHNPLKMRLVFELLLLRKGAPRWCKLEKRREIEKMELVF